MQNKIISSLLINIIPYGQGFLRSEFDITLDIWVEDGYYLASYPMFNIELCEKSIDELRSSFEEEVCFLWDEYACVSDMCLSDEAIRLKEKLLQYFRLCTLDDLDKDISSSSGDFSFIPVHEWDTSFGYVHA